MRLKPLALLAVTLMACSDSIAPAVPDGVDLDALFAPPTQTEIDAVSAEWATRTPKAETVRIEVSEPFSVTGLDATVIVVSNEVGGARHYGGVLVPDSAAPGSLPILVYSHGGDGGVDLDDTFALIPFLLGSDADEYVYVVPSFRSEPLVYDGVTYLSEGEPSPWDFDVDDALALMDVAKLVAPAADPDRVAILGFSRGAGVALLMAARDPSIDIVVEFFGPTDFFDSFVREVVEEAIVGSLRDLPGLDFLNEDFIQPFVRGEASLADVRLEMVRRSAVYYADRIPDLQIHHGTADMTVEVSQAERLIGVMERLGRTAPNYEAYLYTGAGHDPLAMPGSLPRARSFISRILSP